MTDSEYSSTLVWFLQQLSSSQGTLGSKGVMILLREAGHLLEGGDNEGDCRQLGPGVGDFVLVQ